MGMALDPKQVARERSDDNLARALKAEQELAQLKAAAPVSLPAREEVCRAAWEAGRRFSLDNAEDDNGPWPPVAGAYGWQEDDSEMVCEVERAKADAILSLIKGDGRDL